MPGFPVAEPFRSWRLPAGADIHPDAWVMDDLELAVPTREEADRLLDQLEGAGAALRSIPARERARRLGAVGTRLADPQDPLHREALERLPAQAGLSLPVARELLDRMAPQWTPPALERLLHLEFPDPLVLDGFRPRARAGDRVRALGDPMALHVGAGNVAGVGVSSLLRSLLVGTPVLLKPGRGDVVLPILAADALGSTFPEASRALAVIYWPGKGGGALGSQGLARAGRVVVYGGMDTVQDFRSRLSPQTPLIAYHHRVSAAALGREVLEGEVARRTATAAARAVAAYDQQGCVSPHLFWVERGGAVSPESWARMLAQELEGVEALLPSLPTAEVSARVQAVRGEVELDAAMGTKTRLLAPPHAGWTVIYESEFAFEGVCGGRTARVQGGDDLEELFRHLPAVRGILQSVALACPEPRRSHVAEGLVLAGAARITTLDRQPWPEPWWLHDGAGPLRALVRWAMDEGGEPPPPLGGDGPARSR